ncbi:MAG: hypothetical protein BRC28_01190 [Nanohaloarchaea archaeon SW_4_43_9]|nr:MAG: hypothetical protein BRC28_01190 [Nanohaloarchaea archaeon SW_4_43_9]
MRVEKLFKRLKREFLKVNFLQACLDSILFFLSANLLLFLFSLRFTSAGRNLEYLIPLSILIFTLDFYYRSQKYNIEIYEQKNPELRERLRTARDNLESTNIVSQALFDEILNISRSVSSESIIPSKRIIQKMLAIGIISFITVLSGILNFQIMDQGGEILPENTDEIINQITQEEDSFEIKNSSKIYGEEPDAEVDGLINYSIEGSGRVEDTETGSRDREVENIALGETYSGMERNLELAKEYSLAIKEFQ